SNSGIPCVPGRPWKYAVPSACGDRRHGSRSSVNWLPKKAAWSRESVRKRGSASRTPSLVAIPPSSRRSWSIDQPAPSPTSRSRDRGAHRRVRLAATGRSNRLADTELIQPQHVQVAVRDLGQRRQVDPRLALLVLLDQPIEER